MLTTASVKYALMGEDASASITNALFTGNPRLFVVEITSPTDITLALMAIDLLSLVGNLIRFSIGWHPWKGRKLCQVKIWLKKGIKFMGKIEFIVNKMSTWN